MGTTEDHFKHAEVCIEMARQSADDTDRALWVTLAQSWVRLAEDVAQAETSLAPSPDGGAVILEMPLPDRD
jgi:hypothetical protein